MAFIPVHRDQFNITPQGIVHKPTDATFVPSLDDSLKGTIRLGQLEARLPGGDRYPSRTVSRMMHALWKEYVKENRTHFK
jgi:hypothetical protein